MLITMKKLFVHLVPATENHSKKCPRSEGMSTISILVLVARQQCHIMMAADPKLEKCTLQVYYIAIIIIIIINLDITQLQGETVSTDSETTGQGTTNGGT